MLTAQDRLHSAALCALDVSAILANLVLIYAIVTRTPSAMRSYSILLLNNALVDIVSACASMLGVVRLVFLHDGPSQLFVFVGPCSSLGEWCCLLCQTVHACLACHSAILMLQSFCFRLFLLRNPLALNPPPSIAATLAACAFLYAPTAILMYFYSCAIDSVPAERVSSLQLEGYTSMWSPTLTDSRFLIPMTVVSLISPTCMIIIYFARRTLLNSIRTMDQDAQEHHKNIIKALTYQLLLPTGQAIAAAIWLLNVAGIWSDEWPERLVIIASSFFALGSPIINLTFLPPYRRLFSQSTTNTQAQNIDKH